MKNDARIPPGPAEPNPTPARDPNGGPETREPKQNVPTVEDPQNRKAPLGDPPKSEPVIIDPNRRSGAV